VSEAPTIEALQAQIESLATSQASDRESLELYRNCRGRRDELKLENEGLLEDLANFAAREQDSFESYRLACVARDELKLENDHLTKALQQAYNDLIDAAANLRRCVLIHESSKAQRALARCDDAVSRAGGALGPELAVVG
jgi:hypothetical protein